FAGGNNIEMPIEMHERAGMSSAPEAHHIDTRKAGRIRRMGIGFGVIDLKSEAAQPLADEFGALPVTRSGRIDGGYAQQFGGEFDKLPAGRLDLLDHACGERSHANTIRYYRC